MTGAAPRSWSRRAATEWGGRPCENSCRRYGDCYIHRSFTVHLRGWAFVFVVWRSHSGSDGVKLFSGNSNLPLARAIAASIGLELGRCTVSSFPDGETLVKIDEN